MIAIRFFTVIILLFFQFHLVAQHLHWTKYAPKTEETYHISTGTRLDTDKEGNVFVTGIFSGEAVFDHITLTAENQEIFLAKYSNDGSLLWILQFGYSIVANRAGDLKIDHNGDLILTGWLSGPCDFLGQNVEGGAFLAKLDKNGELIWIIQDSETYALNFARFDIYDRGSKIAIDSKNNIIRFSDQINYLATDGGLALSQYSSTTGAMIWRKYITKDDNFFRPRLSGIKLDTKDNIIISGIFNEWMYIGDIKLVSAPHPKDSHLFISKFSKDGNFIWAIQGDKSKISTVFGIETDSLDNIYATGILDNWTMINGKYYNQSQPENGFIARLNPQGEVEWLNTFEKLDIPAYNAVRPFDIARDNDGCYIVSCSFFSAFKYQEYYTVKEKDLQQILVLKIDSKGKFNSMFTSHGPGYYKDAFQSVVDENGNIFTTGHFVESMTLSCDTMQSNGYSFFLSKHDQASLEGIDFKIEGPSDVCENTDFILTTTEVPGATQYIWDLPEGVKASSGSNITSENRIIINADEIASNKFITVTREESCNNKFNYAHTINVVKPQSKPTFTKFSEKICPGTSDVEYVISDNPAIDSYQWSYFGDFLMTKNERGDSAKISFRNNFSSGSISVTGRESLCQDQTTEISIAAFPDLPKISVIGPAEICNTNMTSRWSVSQEIDSLSYHWEFPNYFDLGSGIPDDRNELIATVLPQFNQGNIRVALVGNCGMGEYSEPLNVTALTLPTSPNNVIGPSNVCYETKLEYSTSALDNVETYHWSLFDQSGNVQEIDTKANVVQFIIPQTGLRSLQVYGENECGIGEESNLLEIETIENVIKPTLKKLNCDRELVTSGQENLKWIKNGSLLDNVNDFQLHVVDSGIYKVQVSNFCGLEESESLFVNPVIEDELFIPNIITPNGDGINELFILDSSLKNSWIEIYNRYGKQIYLSNSYQNDWSGENLPSATYYYLIKNICLQKDKVGPLKILY